ncbi:hypothetical protein B0A58_06370 [Flavobacterium branchiophilum NBRC 15030 = ATCC 35035]|uniref:Uncharacterized protein DUF3127 n=1 Tax=Flavobacterium branchiophilum TaxID=55197 RepID=A0A543G856_9FLAO|nr:DUF3127 domain-containing protein [Flavobacterium branchiophilum]OXA76879.1 hypothetical protein B0A58_06370 [Flavobacterium branchiophilum NBRC 15030 = ATCC 35035]TQM42261.1 uncharacterized protein DUF3127 [Flavobacterium branchiophilum]GEM54285.1 hypothetical protein FB1_05060 [Flavobacterium branchiophilum NBRC 15030 = ATCC 35035]
MTITAKLVQVLPLQTGIGKNGEWKKQDIIVETDGQYPKKICVSVWGDKINNNQLQIGNVLNLEFDIESREFNGKWYTDLKAWKVEVINSTTPNHSNTSDSDTIIDVEPDNEDILPF